MHKFYTLLSVFFCFIHFSCGAVYDPIAIYLTWQSDPRTSMVVQWITPNDQLSDDLEYKQENSLEWQKIAGYHQQLPENFPYFVHRIELKNLTPNTNYLFRTGSDGKIYKFQTMPNDLSKPIRFVAGGDIYHDDLETLSHINVLAAKTSPLFALAGGDLAYSAPKRPSSLWQETKEDAKRWLEWLAAWKNEMVTPDGRLIPMIVAIGNHEVAGHYDKTAEQAQFFYTLFPSNGYEVVDINPQLSFFILDTQHTHPINGTQTAWLKQNLEDRAKVKHKFAMYHVGAYPSVRSPDNPIALLVRHNWVPLFEKYGIDAAFENHDHAYKRTYPLLNNRVDPKGVLYIGDGAWGVKVPRKMKTSSKKWYVAKAAPVQNIVVVTVSDNLHEFTVLNSKGEIIDRFRQKV